MLDVGFRGYAEVAPPGFNLPAIECERAEGDSHPPSHVLLDSRDAGRGDILAVSRLDQKTIEKIAVSFLRHR
jgi:hypothetical protein